MIKCDFCRYSVMTEKGLVCNKPAQRPSYAQYLTYISNTPCWTPPQPQPYYDPYAFCTEAIALMCKYLSITNDTTDQK